jgi:hypothetical protein
LRRVLTGLALLAAIATLATTSVFAFAPGAVQSSTSNPGPLNTFGSVSPATITPGLTASYTSNYSFTATASSAAGAAPVGSALASTQSTNISTMYQQWRHNTNPDRWFYLYAGNQSVQGFASAQSGNVAGFNGTSLANATFAYYYYTKARGQQTFASQQALGGFASEAAGGTVGTGVIWLDAGNTFPIARIMGMSANVPVCTSQGFSGAGSPGTRCSASLTGAVRWGLAEEAWPAGGVTLLQAVESAPLASSAVPTAGAPVAVGTAGATVFYDGWNAPTTLALSSTAPAQAASGVTNLGTTAAPGARSVGTAYNLSQTVTDTDADLANGSLIFVFTSGTQNGQWFQFGYANGDNSDNTINVASGSCFYQSSFEASRTSSINALTAQCNPITTSYLTSASASASGTAASETISYTLTFSSGSVGGLTVYGRADDFHGMSSGNVQVGALTVS